MSKHSKWAKIKRQKGATDVKRGVIFSKMSRNITIAARDGLDPNTNFKLRMAMDRALAENMPKDNIERAIERAAKNGDGSALENLTIEARSIGGCAVLVDVVTDSRNRSFGEIRKILSDHDSAPVEPGSMQWLFERKGQIIIENVENLEQAELDAIDAGADEIDNDGTTMEVLTHPEKLHESTKLLKSKTYNITETQLIMRAKNGHALSEEDFNKLQNLLDILDDQEDVVNVTTNAVPA